jgi:tetratricopeptide (TPR) repeat protein
MAHWGIAMSIIHPLWGERPTEAALKKGQSALAKAKALKPSTERESAYVSAAERFFRNWENTAYPAQLAAFEAGFKELHESYPDDIDAAAFYALAHLATAPKADRTFAHQKEAGALLEKLHAKAPEHPGLFHYIIHAYDNPMLADRALVVARGYDKIAPDVPHALHMPSHIFVRLGLWPDAIAWNVRSAAAALRQPVGDATSLHYAHALDYLIYAYLQRSQDGKAQEVLEKMNAVANFQPSFITAYAIAAVQARYPLERGRWAEAAALPLRTHGSFPWGKYPGAESITYFARGIGAARSGDTEGARQAIEALEKLHAQMVQSGESYWAVHADAQRKSVAAWLAFSGDDKKQALKLMREAADLEDSVDKHPVTPSAVLPARELLGDMLLSLKRSAEAIRAYEASLRISPNRFNSLYGAGRAAELAGDKQKANTYYMRLVEISSEADAETPAIAQARQFLAKK